MKQWIIMFTLKTLLDHIIFKTSACIGLNFPSQGVGACENLRPFLVLFRTDMLVHVVNQTDQVMPVPMVLQRLDQGYSTLINNTHTAFIKNIFVSSPSSLQLSLLQKFYWVIVTSWWRIIPNMARPGVGGLKNLVWLETIGGIASEVPEEQALGI